MDEDSTGLGAGMGALAATSESTKAQAASTEAGLPRIPRIKGARPSLRPHKLRAELKRTGMRMPRR
jgi:hypothetical protein